MYFFCFPKRKGGEYTEPLGLSQELFHGDFFSPHQTALSLRWEWKRLQCQNRRKIIV